MRVDYLLMMLIIRRLPVFFFPVFLILLSVHGLAQCISAFPYKENFENNIGGWTTGGTASDWAWGSPSKKVITKAGSGSKCWIVGGLTGNFYNNNEKSWLQGPCFNFSTLKNPYISFLVNWDTEGTYDGAALQYSTDNGITWLSAGVYGDQSTGCNTNNNWYNTSSITYGYVSGANGWSGSGSGSGSGGWVTAYHSFLQLAGKTNVMFRFVFGAGNKQNDFSGFAVDDLYIGETTNDPVAFTYSCASVSGQVSFTAQNPDCIKASTLSWDFGDPASGADNTSSVSNAVHKFSGPGIYKVTLSGIVGKDLTTSSPQTVIIPDLNVSVTTPIACNGGTGTATASVTNTNNNVAYSWAVNPVVTTPSAQLKAGVYDVTASVTGGCPVTKSIPLSEPAALAHAVQTRPADCNNQNGSITVAESGGVEPYRYAWQGLQYSTPSLNSLPSGNYSILVTDKNLCTDKVDVPLAIVPSTLSQTYAATIPDCGIANGSVQINTTGGSPDYSYQWKPSVSSGNTAANLESGNYMIVASDKDNCHDTIRVALTSKPLTVSLGGDTVVCKGQSVLLKPSGNFTSYLWNDGTTNASELVSKEGNYTVTVTNAGGCKASDTVHVSVGCGDLVFPSVFTPNGDGLNEQFGPSGGLSLVSSYQLLIYNRFGNLVFRSVNPYQKWKGDISGKMFTGTYTYIATYMYDGGRKIKKGTIVLFF